MKETLGSQLVEQNRPQREFVQPGPLELNSMPKSFGVTTRKLRFTRASAENYLEDSSNPVHDLHSSLRRARPGELALDLAEGEFIRKASSKEFGKLGSHENIRSAAGASDRVLRSSQGRVSSSVTSAKEDLKLEIYRDQSPGIVMRAHSTVDESNQDFLSPVLRKSTPSSTDKEALGKADRGKENRDPHGELDATSRRSPLPEWYRRKPLQDITNVLAAALGDEQQPQPKKKLKKKMGSFAAPSFPMLSETQTRRKDATITQPNCSSVATPKQFSNLGKNFR